LLVDLALLTPAFVCGLQVVRAAIQIQFLSLTCDIAVIAEKAEKAEKAELLAARLSNLNMRRPQAGYPMPFARRTVQ